MTSLGVWCQNMTPNRLAWNFISMYKRFINVEMKTTYITKRDTIEDIIFSEFNILPHTYTN